MKVSQKCVSHFKVNGDPLFKQEQLRKCLIVDDQVNAIKHQDILLLSKKFQQFFNHSRRTRMYDETSRDIVRKTNAYQFPIGKNFELRQVTVQYEDFTRCYKDFGLAGTSNQMYEMSSHITRLYLHQVCLEPAKFLASIQRQIRQGIFAGMRVNF